MKLNTHTSCLLWKRNFSRAQLAPAKCRAVKKQLSFGYDDDDDAADAYDDYDAGMDMTERGEKLLLVVGDYNLVVGWFVWISGKDDDDWP